MNGETRERLKSTAVTVWLKADLDTLMERVSRRSNRPLLKTADPRETMRRLIKERYPIYGQADIVIESRNVKREQVAGEVAEAVQAFLERNER